MKAKALVTGFVATFVLSLATDQLFHVLGVYPPGGQRMDAPALNALALSYRLFYDGLGSYIAARMAPQAPMKHAMVLGGIGLVLCLLGVAGAMAMPMGPLWYPIALAISVLPTAWIGGQLAQR
jgi:hypothetical protein